MASDRPIHRSLILKTEAYAIKITCAETNTLPLFGWATKFVAHLVNFVWEFIKNPEIMLNHNLGLY